MVPTILIIEDNKELAEYLKELLESNIDCKAIIFTSGIESIKFIKANKPDLLLVDLYLEDIHGKTICEEVRKLYDDVPIIILTGEKSSKSVVECLNSGADDYVTKPFNADVLLARVKARIRNLTNDPKSTILKVHELTLNTETLEVYLENKKIELTTKEYELLHYLMQNEFRVCTRDKILFAVWGYTSEVDTRVVDVHIGKLRKKLTNKKYDYIKSYRGFGYRLVDPEDDN